MERGPELVDVEEPSRRDAIWDGRPARPKAIQAVLNAVWRWRRLLVSIGAVVFAVVIIVAGRSGLSTAPSLPEASVTPTRTLAGKIVDLAVGEKRIYALVDPCVEGRVECPLVLVASVDEGINWQRLPLPPGRRWTTTTTQDWRLAVDGPDDRLAITDEDRRTTYLQAKSGGYESLSYGVGSVVASIPIESRHFAQLCRPPLCASSVVEVVDPSTALHHRLLTQPPLTPRTVATDGFRLWVAGVGAQRRFAIAVSSDGGATWQTTELPQANTDPSLTATVVPTPGKDAFFLLLGYPQDDGSQSLYDVWTVAESAGRHESHRVKPQRALTVKSAVGLDNGMLLLSNGFSAFRLSPSGGVTSPGTPDKPQPTVIQQVMRGAKSQVLGSSIASGAPAIALSSTGDPNDWTVRLINLPR